MQEGGGKSLPPWSWFGAVCLLERLRQPALQVLHRQGQGSEHKVRGGRRKRRLARPVAFCLLPSFCCDCTCCMWPAGTEGSRSHSAVTRQLPPCQLPPSPHWEKGSRSRRRGRRSSLQSCHLHGSQEAPWNGHSGTRLFWRGDSLGSPGSLKTEGKREKPAESIKGCGVL